MVGHECGIATVHSKFHSAPSDGSNITKVAGHISSSESIWALNAVGFAFEVKTKLGQGKNEHRLTPTCIPSNYVPPACLPHLHQLSLVFWLLFFLFLCILGSLLEISGDVLSECNGREGSQFERMPSVVIRSLLDCS